MNQNYTGLRQRMPKRNISRVVGLIQVDAADDRGSLQLFDDNHGFNARALEAEHIPADLQQLGSDLNQELTRFRASLLVNRETRF